MTRWTQIVVQGIFFFAAPNTVGLSHRNPETKISCESCSAYSKDKTHPFLKASPKFIKFISRQTASVQNTKRNQKDKKILYVKVTSFS
jgi:hypothetical protein